MTDATFLAWLQSGTRRVILIEASYHDGSSAHTVYLSQGGYTSYPGDTPANTIYIDIATAPQFEAKLGDTLTGVAVPTWGDIDLIIADAEHQAWLDFAWGGWPLSLWIGAPDWPRADFRQIFSGVCEDIVAKDGVTYSLKVKDIQALLNTPVSTRTVSEPELVSGLTWRIAEGAVTSIDSVEDDGVAVSFTANAAQGRFTLASAPVGRLSVAFTGGEASKGALIPIALGKVFNASPVLLNGGLHRYRLNDSQTYQIDAVRADGIAIAYTSDLSRGVLDLSSTPQGQVCVDVRGQVSAGSLVADLAGLVKLLLTRYGGLNISDLDASSFAAFAASHPQTLGIYISDRTNLLDVLDQLLRSLGAWLWPDRQGKLRIGQLTVPTVATAPAIGVDDLDAHRDIKLLQRILPAKSVTLKYRRNYTPQTNFKDAVSESLRASLQQPWAQVSVNNPTVASIWRNAREAEIETCLVDDAEARTEALRQLSLASTPRKVWSLPTLLTPLTWQLGDVVPLDLDRTGLDDGRLAVVVGISEALLDNTANVEVWL